MSSKSNYLQAQLLNLMFRTQVAWKPSAVWIAFFTTPPTDAGGGSEVAGGGYSRVQVAQSDAQWAAPSGTPRSITNVNTITFPSPTTSWGLVTAFGVYDAPTGGNLLYWGYLVSPKTVNGGDPAPFVGPGLLNILEA